MKKQLPFEMPEYSFELNMVQELQKAYLEAYEKFVTEKINSHLKAYSIDVNSEHYSVETVLFQYVNDKHFFAIKKSNFSKNVDFFYLFSLANEVVTTMPQPYIEGKMHVNLYYLDYEKRIEVENELRKCKT